MSTLLTAADPAPVIEFNAGGASDFVITVDHASARIPLALQQLGVESRELERHIAWDIGALGMAERMATRLDAHLIASAYSRLVIDCNRDPAVASSIPTVSEYTEIAGNVDLDAAARQQRIDEIFWPYQRRLAALLDERAAAGRQTILVCQHSMTDCYKGSRRSMHAAILYNRDRRYAGAVLDALRAQTDIVVADNEPYFVSDDTDYTVPVHAERRGLLHVEIEVRQDLIRTVDGQAAWADRLVLALNEARLSCLGVI